MNDTTINALLRCCNLQQAGGCHCYLVAIVAGLGPMAIIIGSVIVAAGPQVRTLCVFV